MTSPPNLSVILPVLDGMALLPRSIGALLESDLERDRWELIVADDGSTDGSGAWAQSHADRVVRIDGGPRGPGFARNVAATVATGDILVFVDADVCVHPDTLGRFARAFEGREEIGAVFGAYDDRPAAPSFLSQYRNLLHRYVHLRGSGEAETFWAGCGAVRRNIFLDLGGFDVEKYPRPQIEDIELGYRIRARGYRIVLDPAIQGTHLKAWSLRSIVKTDLLDRGIPWARLMLGGGSQEATLNVGFVERLKVGLVGMACLLGFGGLLTGDGRIAAGAGAALAAFLLTNVDLYRWFAGRRGWWFAMRVLPFNLLYYFISGLAAFVAILLHILPASRARRRSPSESGASG